MSTTTRHSWLIGPKYTVGAVMLLVLAPFGCSGPQKSRPAERAAVPSPKPMAGDASLDEQRRARYADCRVGRFAVLADFEQPFQPFGLRAEPPERPASLLEEPAADQAGDLTSLIWSPDVATANIAWPPAPVATQPSIMPDDSAWLAFPSRAAATGKQSLAWRVRAANDSLRIGQLAKMDSTDWTDYALLNISIHSPDDDVPIDIELWGSDPRGSRHSIGGINLAKGWNLVRVDLATVQSVDLADIRAIWLVYRPGLGTPQGHTPHPGQANTINQHAGDVHPDAERSFVRPPDPAAPRDALLIDDVLLIDNTRYVLGSATQVPGQLFVRWRGRALQAGIAHAHRVTIRAGPIERLTDIRPPGRPMQVAAQVGPVSDSLAVEELQAIRSAPGDEPAGWRRGSDADQRVDSPGQVRVLESNPLRAVIEASSPIAADPSRATLCRYWIYAGGQMHVASRLSPDEPGAVGTVTRWRTNAGEGFDPDALVADDAGRWVLSSGQRHAGQPALVMGVSAPLQDGVEFLGVVGGHACWLMPRSEQPRAIAQRVEFFAGSPDVALGEALYAAIAKPLERSMSLGEVAVDRAWDVDRDGFAEMEGVYNFRVQAGRLRARLARPSEAATQSPGYRDVILRVLGVPPDRPTYVAVDSQPIAGVLNLARDADGELLIRLPRPVLTAVDIDVRVLGEE